MSVSWMSGSCSAALAMFAFGCQTQTAPSTTGAPTAPVHADGDDQHTDDDDHGESDIAVALGKLSAEDRKAAEAQKYCAVLSGSLLGSMGTPLKLEIKGESVFLCCSGCKSKAMESPDKTLAAVAKLKADNGAVEN